MIAVSSMHTAMCIHFMRIKYQCNETSHVKYVTVIQVFPVAQISTGEILRVSTRGSPAVNVCYLGARAIGGCITAGRGEGQIFCLEGGEPSWMRHAHLVVGGYLYSQLGLGCHAVVVALVGFHCRLPVTYQKRRMNYFD